MTIKDVEERTGLRFAVQPTLARSGFPGSRNPFRSEKSGNSVAFTRMTLPLLSDTAPKLLAG